MNSAPFRNYTMENSDCHTDLTEQYDGQNRHCYKLGTVNKELITPFPDSDIFTYLLTFWSISKDIIHFLNS